MDILCKCQDRRHSCVMWQYTQRNQSAIRTILPNLLLNGGHKGFAIHRPKLGLGCNYRGYLYLIFKLGKLFKIQHPDKKQILFLVIIGCSSRLCLREI